MVLWNGLESGPDGGVVECQTTASPNLHSVAVYYSPSNNSQPVHCGDALQLAVSSPSSWNPCPTGTPTCQHAGQGSNVISYCSSQTLQSTADQTFGNRPYVGFSQFFDEQCTQPDADFALSATYAPSISAAPCVGVMNYQSITWVSASFKAVVTTDTATPTVFMTMFGTPSCGMPISNYNFAVSDALNAPPPCFPMNDTLGAAKFWQPFVSTKVTAVTSSSSSFVGSAGFIALVVLLPFFIVLLVGVLVARCCRKDNFLDNERQPFHLQP